VSSHVILSSYQRFNCFVTGVFSGGRGIRTTPGGFVKFTFRWHVKTASHLGYQGYATAVDTGTGELHSMPPTSLRGAFGGFLPPKCALFIAATAGTTTTASFAASGNQVTIKGMSESVA